MTFLRALIRAIAVTACDISSNAKPWEVNKDTVRVIFEEFYAQVRKYIYMLLCNINMRNNSRYNIFTFL